MTFMETPSIEYVRKALFYGRAAQHLAERAPDHDVWRREIEHHRAMATGFAELAYARVDAEHTPNSIDHGPGRIAPRAITYTET